MKKKVGYCYPSGLEKTVCKWDIYVPLVTKGLKRVWQMFIGRLEKSVSSLKLGGFFCAFHKSCPGIITLFVLEGTAFIFHKVVEFVHFSSSLLLARKNSLRV
jgi:hypothetical protein